MAEIYKALSLPDGLYTVKQIPGTEKFSVYRYILESDEWCRVRGIVNDSDNFWEAVQDLRDCTEELGLTTVGWYNGENTGSTPVLTEEGLRHVNFYINELWAKRKEILDAGIDTAEDTEIATVADICSDIDEETIEDYGDGPEYCNGWPVTDSYDADYCLRLSQGKDFVIIEQGDDNEL